MGVPAFKRCWSFHWDQRFDGLTTERQLEIREWIDSLDDDQFKMLQEVAEDLVRATEWNEYYNRGF